MQLKDNVAVVTGAAGGIGQEIARTFAREGAKLVIADRNQAGGGGGGRARREGGRHRGRHGRHRRGAGRRRHGEIVALTRAVIYEISKAALSPLLKARPGMAEELSESLASRRLAQRTVLDLHHHKQQPEAGPANRLAANIRRLFLLH